LVALAEATGRTRVEAEAACFVVLYLAIWPSMAAVSRCRWLSGLLGSVLVRHDGLPPSRLRCALRELVAWAPPLGLALLAVALGSNAGWGTPAWAIGSAWALPGLWALADMAHELACPGMMLHDRLARTRLVAL